MKRDNGEPYETAWGGTCLDLTNPDVREYVRTVADRIVNEWGFRYLKLDGLWTGTATKQQYVNSGFKDDGIGDAVFHDPNVTNIEAYRSGLKLVRETVGRKTFILGCNGPQNMRSYGGAFGLVDAMRVGPRQRRRVGSLAARAGVRLAALLSARPHLVQRPRPRLRARFDAAGARAARLLVGGASPGS